MAFGIFLKFPTRFKSFENIIRAIIKHFEYTEDNQNFANVRKNESNDVQESMDNFRFVGIFMKNKK
jgi:hypothetical protein